MVEEHRRSSPTPFSILMLLTAYALKGIILMAWIVEFHDDFDPEFEDLAAEVQDELYAQLKVLRLFGPETGRPQVDTLNGSAYAKMKELRFDAADGVWRVAFAFDPKRKAILLVAGDKHGVGEKPFYKQLIKVADARFGQHLKKLKKEEQDAKAAERKAKKGKKGAKKK